MNDFLNIYKNVTWLQIYLEIIVFIFGILSVWLAKKENIWVYPTGLITTTITCYLLYQANFIGDMIINGYFSIMSIYGWIKWQSKTTNSQNNLQISTINNSDKIKAIGLFVLTIIVIYFIYLIFNYTIKTENYFDILSSGIFFAAMWLMAHKKIENWWLWITGNLIVIPLYAYRNLGMLSLQYIIFTILAIIALKQWKKKLIKIN